jgi:hypothetical protein
MLMKPSSLLKEEAEQDKAYLKKNLPRNFYRSGVDLRFLFLNTRRRVVAK